MGSGVAKILGSAKRPVIVFFVLLVVFVLAMTIAFALPQDSIRANARTSAETLASEGLYPRILPHMAFVLDNYTDALMIDVALAEPGDSAFKAGMGAVHGNSVDAATGGVSPILSLTDSSWGRRQSADAYAYYWHGYQVFLRPALMLFDYTDIRFINIVALSLLGLAVMFGVDRECGRAAAMSLGLAIALTGYFVVPLSLQFSNMTYLTLAATLAMLALLRSGRIRHLFAEFFLVVGMLAAFFDLLTTPLLTLCIPLAVFLVASSRTHTRGITAYIRMTVKAGVIWAVGYTGAWVAKWFIATAAIGRDFVGLALDQIMFRTGLDGRSAGPVEAISSNLETLRPLAVPTQGMLWTIVLLLVIALFAFAIVRYRRPMDEVRTSLVPMLLIPLPYMWFAVANNHSINHFFFVFRIQLVVVFVVTYAVLSTFDPQRIKEDFSAMISRS